MEAIMEYITLTAMIITAIISIITLIITLKNSKSNTDKQLTKKIDSLTEAERQSSSNLEKFAAYVDNTLKINFRHINEGFADIRHEISDSQIKQRQETGESLNQMRQTIYTSLEDIYMNLNKQNSEEFAKLRTEIISAQKNQREEINNINMLMMKQVQDRLKAIEESNSIALEKIRSNVDEQLSKTLSERLNASFGTVNKQLENVYKSIGEMKELSTEVNSLNRIFTNVKARGTWAEYQLENILEQTIPGMYERNYKPDAGKIVEFAIKIPQKNGSICYLPLDSKFPVEDYLRIKTAADNCNTAELEEAKKALIQRVKLQAREITKYIIPPATTPFAVMYLPTEGLYNEVLSTDGLAENLQSTYHVMLAGPNSINALLTSLQIGFSAIKINEKADEISNALATFKSQFIRFNEDLEKVHSHIEKAENSIVSVTRRSEKIVKNLSSFETSDFLPASDSYQID